MKQLKLSVIIPVYNGERCIEAAVRSVLTQTLRDFDIWIVDDGSEDRTAEIVDSLATKYERVHVIHQANVRAYAARIAGIKASSSEYVAFVDADDVVDVSMYQRMVEFADSHNLDVVQCDVKGRKGRDPEFFLTEHDILKDIVFPRILKGVDSMCVWDKVYRRSVFPSTWLESSLLMFEDLALNMQIFEHVERAAYLHEGLYNYQISAQSSVRNYKSRSVIDFDEICRLRNLWLPKYDFSDWVVENSRWVVKNAFNNLRLINSAPGLSWGDRIGFARQIAKIAVAHIPVWQSTSINLAFKYATVRVCVRPLFTKIVCFMLLHINGLIRNMRRKI